MLQNSKPPLISKSVKTRNLKASSKNSKATMQASFFSDNTSLGRTQQAASQSHVFSSLAVVRQPSEQKQSGLPRLLSSKAGGRARQSIAVMPAAVVERSASRDSRGRASRNLELQVTNVQT